MQLYWTSLVVCSAALRQQWCSDCRVRRLPGIPSSQLGLESYTGELDNFGVESYIGFPGEGEVPGPDMHSVIEAQLKMGTKPLKRTIF